MTFSYESLASRRELQPFAEELQRYITPVFLEELAILIIQSHHISLAGFFESVYS